MDHAGLQNLGPCWTVNTNGYHVTTLQTNQLTPPQVTYACIGTQNTKDTDVGYLSCFQSVADGKLSFANVWQMSYQNRRKHTKLQWKLQRPISRQHIQYDLALHSTTPSSTTRFSITLTKPANLLNRSAWTTCWTSSGVDPYRYKTLSVHTISVHNF